MLSSHPTPTELRPQQMHIGRRSKQVRSCSAEAYKFLAWHKVISLRFRGCYSSAQAPGRLCVYAMGREVRRMVHRGERKGLASRNRARHKLGRRVPLWERLWEGEHASSLQVWHPFVESLLHASTQAAIRICEMRHKHRPHVYEYRSSMLVLQCMLGPQTRASIITCASVVSVGSILAEC